MSNRSRRVRPRDSCGNRHWGWHRGSRRQVAGNVQRKPRARRRNPDLLLDPDTVAPVGTLLAFLSTLAVVVVLMVALFRSVRWALLGVIPVLWTVLVVYGTIGLVGKDYDAPIAILSTLVLGIGVDFAIHFVQRYRELAERHGPGPEAIAAFFQEPARALTRNAIIIAVGFTPLFLSPLVPYLVVGALLSSLMILSWLATILVLPSLVALGHRHSDETQHVPVLQGELFEETKTS